MEIYWFMFIGHLLGDYPLQNAKMAQNNKRNDIIGWGYCIVHCLIYTLSVIIWLIIAGYKTYPTFILLVFLSHIILDKTRLVEKYMDWMGITTWYGELPLTHNVNADYINQVDDLDEVNWYSFDINTKTIVLTSMGAFVYIMCDNAIHLALLTLLLKFY